VALYLLDPDDPALAALEEEMIADLGIMERDDAGAAPVRVEPGLAISDDEDEPPPGGKEVGTILPEGGRPVQLATEELILYPRDEDQLQRFLTETGGEVLATQEVAAENDGTHAVEAHLVRIDPDRARTDRLPQLRSLFGETGTLLGSKEDALGVYALALHYQLEGYLVAVNPRLQLQGAPRLTTEEANNVSFSMEMTPAAGTSPDCVPGDPTRPCVRSAPALWSYLALTDRDEQRVPVAFLDTGFATNDDFRQPATGEMVECEVDAFGRGYECEPGAAQGKQLVGNSLFGGKTWHGTGVVVAAGGVVNDGFGTAGSGGQVVVPMLYRYDLASYAFEFGLGMRLATDQGASCINISGGYPCNILTSIGPDFDICTRAGRAAMCAEVVGAAAAAAGIVCGVGTFIPFLGQIACSVAIGGVVVTTDSCIASIALFGDLKGPMGSGVRYATRSGVPVVTVAGNALTEDSVPPVIREAIDFSDPRTERWKIVPAMFEDAIVVGAVDAGLDNGHFYGDRVDVWSPTNHAYLAPDDPNDIASPEVLYRGFGTHPGISATSGAAPYVAGVIAAMQAVNPGLNRATPGLGGAPERSGIPGRIRDLLTSDEATLDNDELVDLGYTDQPEERRTLIDPLGAVRAAARDAALVEFSEPLPDLAALGYDTSLNFDEALPFSAHDDRSDPRFLTYGQAEHGTVVTLSPPDDPSLFAADEDWFTADVTGPADRVARVRAKLRYPRRFGRPTIIGDPSFALGPSDVSDEEDEDVYEALVPTGEDVELAVRGSVDGDNVYELTVEAPEVVDPKVAIVEPTTSSSFSTCADSDVTLRAEASYEDAPDLDVPVSRLAWTDDGAPVGDGESVTIAFPEGQHLVEVRAFGDAGATDTLQVDAVACSAEPPTAEIVQPASDVTVAPDGYDHDKNMSYADVTLEGSATDPEDGTLGGDALAWSTNRSDLQDEDLGTGTSLTVRLYAEDVCDAGSEHVITLVATDSAGNPSAPVERRIDIYQQIC
jgi:hypothetical protein